MPVLDHIVILLPHAVLEALPAAFAGAFTVLTGGQHADGRTENKLVLFQDGVYVELIAFVNGLTPERRAGHRWGDRPEGHIVDWAFSLLQTTPGDEGRQATDAQFKTIQARVQAANVGLTYEDLVPGGRTTPDGVVIKWATASASFGSDTDPVGGALPFWCLDRTERRLRVPYASGAWATHPSGAVGVAGVTVHVRDAALLGRLRHAYDAILDAQAGGAAGEHVWALATPESARTGRAPQLTLALLDAEKLGAIQAAGQEAAGYLELSLFTTGAPQTIDEQFVDGWHVVIRLVKL